MALLPVLIALPFVGGFLAWLAGLRGSARAAWSVALLTLVAQAVLLLALTFGTAGAEGWRAHFLAPWVPMLGISLRFDADGLSLVMLWLNLLVALPSVLLPSRAVADRQGLFYFLMLAVVAGVNGVFLATDLFLFFFFWELMLLPLFGVILLWGNEGRARAVMKFFLFTQGGGLLMLLSILALAFVHLRETGVLTFDYFALSGTGAFSPAAPLISLGFFIAFAVKLPILPFHVWLPDTYAEAPTPASILLAGVLAKTGAYGLIRFVVQLFPNAAHDFALLPMVLGTVGILYCAWLAVSQDDVKRLIAYSSISHLGYVLLGIFSFTRIGMEGAVIQMVAHGLSTGGLFVVAGFVEDRTGTRDMTKLGGLWPAIAPFSAFAIFFACASLGLPGIGNFVGEFLTLMGAWQFSHVLTFFAAFGAVLSSVYALTMILRVFYGPPRSEASEPLGKSSARESVGVLTTLAAATVLLLGLGFYPQPVLDLSLPASPRFVPPPAVPPAVPGLAEEPTR